MNTKIIGERIKDLRLKKKLSQKELAARCGFTNSLLSKIESGQTSSAIATLSKIADELGVTLSWLVQEEVDAPLRIVKKEERTEYSAGSSKDYTYELLANISQRSFIEPVIVHVSPKDNDFDVYTHKEDEFIYVVKGTIQLQYDNQIYELSQGDSVYFQGNKEHVFLPNGADEAVVLSIFITV